MLNTSSAADSRFTRSGKDGAFYNNNGVMVASVETYKSTVNFSNASYKVSLSFTELVIESDEFFTDIMNAMEAGDSPRWNFQGAIQGRNDSEERVMYRDVLPDGDIDIHNLSVGDAIKRQFNCTVNNPPKLASLLGTGR